MKRFFLLAEFQNTLWALEPGRLATFGQMLQPCLSG